MRSTFLISTTACLAFGALAVHPLPAQAQDEMIIQQDPAMGVTRLSTQREETGAVSSSDRSSDGVVRLTLSGDQKSFVRDGLLRTRGGPLLNIATGERLPDRVPTQPVPRSVADRVPDLAPLDYFVSDDRIVLIDPQSHAIVDVIQ